ncbi:MAG: hypothetical protein KKC43_03480 [Alphaproteobacteria bacterium]|nr:hypothetical protein [Alphaproteobacteria bacterium]
MPEFKNPRIPDWALAISLASLVALLGLWPHLFFMNEIGEFRYFHGAYDEDTYTLGWLNGTLRTTRLLSGAALSLVHGLTGSSIDTTLVLSDIVFPFIVICCAYFAASQLVNSPVGRVTLTLLLAFANDLLSLGNLTIWNTWPRNLAYFSDLVTRLTGRDLVPAYETTFLAIFRTPEPQLSFALMFLIFGLLAHLAKSEKEARPLAFALLTLAVAVSPLGYTFVTFPVTVIVLGCIVTLPFVGRRKTAISLALGLIGGLMILVVVQYAQQAGAQSSEGVAMALSFDSRLPIATPATLASAVLGLSFALYMLLWRRWEPLSFLALGCLLAPVVLSNQQIVTGKMISARDWERVFNSPALVFGCFTALKVINMRIDSKFATSIGAAGVIFCCFIAFVLIRGQDRSIQMWTDTNLQSVAVARALATLDPDVFANVTVVLDRGGLGSLVQLRTSTEAKPLLNFYSVGIRLVPNMAPDAVQADPSPYEDTVFAYWLRSGISDSEAEQLLRREISQRSGMFSNFLFSFRDAWYPSSDNRAVRTAELERSVGLIIARYQRYLSLERTPVLANPAVFVSESAPNELRSMEWIDNEYIGLGKAGDATAYLYRQVPRP